MKLCLDCGKEKSRIGIYCKVCGYKHRIRPSGLIYKIVKENSSWFKKGNKSWNKGRQAKNKENYSNDYSAVHNWVERVMGRPRKCDKCGDTTKSRYHWANKTGKYLHETNDWVRLCTKCHFRYDFEKFGLRKTWYIK